ncbi:hypothetical protein Tco_1467410 [Tanacetum coccineum]
MICPSDFFWDSDRDSKVVATLGSQCRGDLDLDLDWQEIFSFSDWDAWFLSFRLSSRLKSIFRWSFLFVVGGGFGGIRNQLGLTLRLLIVRRFLMTLFLGPFYGVLVDVIGFFLGRNQRSSTFENCDSKGWIVERWRIQAEANDEVEKLMSTEIVPSQHVSDKAYLILLGKQGEMRSVHGQVLYTYGDEEVVDLIQGIWMMLDDTSRDKL